MSYENPVTVVDTESAKIRAAGMASFGQSVGGAITALGERQRAEAKQRLKENKELLNNKTKNNDVYQQNIWQAQDAFKTEAGFDISPQVSAQFNTWADEGADLKARRDASDDPILRRELQGQINVYDKFFLGGGMTSQFESFTSMQSTVMDKAGPGKGGTVGNLSLSSIDNQTLNDFTATSSNGGKGLTVSGNSTTQGEDGSWSPLSLSANFTGGGSYNMSTIGNGDLVTIPDMQDGAQVALEKGGFVGKGNKIDPTSREFLDNYAKMEDGKSVMTTRVVAGKTIEYVEIDEEKFLNTLSGTYDATIASYSRGSIQEGDSSTGLRQMQAYVDDVLDDMPESDWARFSELTGIPLLKDGGGPGFTLTAGSHEIEGGDGTVLDKNSYDNLKKALGIQKYLEVDKKVQGIEIPAPKTISAADKRALNQQKSQLELDQKLAGVIDKAIQSPKGVDLGLYDYLMDGANAEALDYGELKSKTFREDIIPVTEYKEWVASQSKKDFYAMFPNESHRNDGEYEFLDKQISDNPDSNFISINPDRPLEFLDPESAYRVMIQTVPAFSELEVSDLSKARGERDLKERDRKLTPEYKMNEEIKQLGSQKKYINSQKKEGLSGKRKSGLVLAEEYLAKIEAIKEKYKK